ncbi:MAG: hypothetical protein KAJ98_14850 [Spirochaetaceae bacterium]|nr:hypothetical protein [Spirochaetaceae bacterium]
MFRALIAIRRLLLITATLTLTISAAAQESSIDYDQRIVQVLEGYQELMSVPMDEDVEDLPGNTWYIVSQAINKGFLRFTVDPITDSLIRGARFHAEPGNDTTHIIITTNLLDIWASYPSMTYSILTRSFRDAVNFFRNPPVWGAAQNDSMELLFMRLDQYNVEARLIRDRLLLSGFLLTPYEAYILDSFEKDELASVILYFEKFSLPVARGLYDARLELERDMDEAEIRAFIIELGETLLKSRNDIPSGSEDELIYPLAAAIHTWLEFTPFLISRIHNRDRQDNPLTFDQILDREREYTETRRRLEASRTGDMPLMNHIYEETISGFEGR